MRKLLLLLLLALSFSGAAAGQGLSGSWALTREKGGASEGGEAIPLEAVTNVRELAIEDDGASLKIAYPSGRKRAFLLDGEERTLDDGDGPARVRAKRSGNTVTIASKWPDGRSLSETWELSPSPRRLHVTGKASGRRGSAKYERTYEPAPPRPTPSPTAAPAPAASPSAPAAPVPAPVGGECSVKPPRGARHEEMEGLAKITLKDAEAKAVAAVAPRKVASIIASGVERDEKGCLVFPIDLRFEGSKEILEVAVDAGDGKVLSVEPPRD